MSGRGWKVAVLALGISAVIALFWLASEAHYEACVNAVVATTATPKSDITPANPLDLVERGEARYAGVAGCSHSPF